jgi:putative tryptophan/tyrosine transport system substrate-binding protein
MAKIAIIHSGTKGNHKNHIDVFKAGVDTTANPKPSYDSDRYADDDDPSSLFDDAIKNGADLLIAAGGTACALAAVNASKQKPVVFTSISDATSPAPGQMTGISASTLLLDKDRLDLLTQALNKPKNIGVLFNKNRKGSDQQIKDITDEAKKIGVTPDPKGIDPSSKNPDMEDQLDAAFLAWKNSLVKIDGVLIAADPAFNNHRMIKNKKNGLIAVAKKYKMPTMYQWSEFPENGGFMSFGPNFLVAYYLAGTYAGQIITDSKNISLPVLSLAPELVINLDVAGDLGITVPASLLTKADRIIITPKVARKK